MAELVDTAAAANAYRLPKAANCRWRSFSAENLVQRGLRLSVGPQAISSAPRPPRLIGAALSDRYELLAGTFSPPRRVRTALTP